MKFSCSRCNTRYSIADERVRGKILKIRCKNCSAVITVKEDPGALPSAKPVAQKQQAPSPKPKGGGRRLPSPGAAAARVRRDSAAASIASSAAKKPAGSALSDAFAKAMTEDRDPSASDSLSASPVSMDVDWYVAEGGVQSGPFRLDKARDWVGSRSPTAELYCWADGFDDWRRVASVSQFANVERRAAGFGDGAPTAIQPGSSSAGPGPAAGGRVDLSSLRPDTGPDLEIGEVSRVVRLPILPPTERSATAAAGLPGVEAVPVRPRGQSTAPPIFARTGGVPALLPRKPAHSRGFWALMFVLGAAVIAMAGFLLYLSMDTEDDGPSLRRSQVAGKELGYRLEGVPSKRSVEPEVVPGTTRSADSRKTSPRRNGTTTAAKTSRKGVAEGTSEVDLSATEDDASELSPDDVLEKYRKSGFAINRCYERAKKRDPFLEVKRAKVKVSIDMQGRASASIPGIQNQALRSCLEATIRGWRFRKPKEPFRAELTMLFKDR